MKLKLEKISSVSSFLRSYASNASSSHVSSSIAASDSSKWCHLSRMWAARMLFIASLCAVAASLGFAANSLLSDSETELAESQFLSITVPALYSARQTLLRRRMGSVSLATVAGNIYPNKESWPNVMINGYEEIAGNLLRTSSEAYGFFGLLPLVRPEQRSDFEKFAYTYLEANYPLGTGVGPGMEKGIYSRDYWGPEMYTLNSTAVKWGSPNDILAPYIQSAGPAGSDRVLMFNVHSLKSRGMVMDDVISCSDKRAASGDLTKQCTCLSDALFVSEDQILGPGAIFMDPIYPAYNKEQLTGFVTTGINWVDVLQNVVPEETNGIDCVLTTPTQTHTFHISGGTPSYTGNGDLHDPDFDAYRQTIVLTNSEHFSDESPTYTLSFYPTDDFFDTYSTRNPLYATVGAVAIIIFTSLVFFFYDGLVRIEFHNSQAVLEAKRKFMRFVSHEVRTPLNTVVMGLKLMQEEVTGLVSKKSSQQSRFIKADQEKSNEVIKLSQQILDSAENAVAVLSDMLNYDKIERGQLTLEPTILAIWHLVEKCTMEFKLPFEAKNITFKLNFLMFPEEDDIELSPTMYSTASDLPLKVREQRVVGDSIRITQVLRNLVSNAMKFTPENGKVTVDITWQTPTPANNNKTQKMEEFKLSNYDKVVSFQRSGVLQVTVRDTGAGLSPDQVERLFQSGVQFNANALQGGKGSGLGLYIAKGIVEQHGGSLVAASKGLGHGTSFTMTLPLHHIPDSALPEGLNRLQLGEGAIKSTAKLERSIPDITETQIDESTVHEPYKILVVDDAVMNRKLLTRLLEKRGYECDQAEDGVEALEKVKAARGGRPYDSILMDYEMPRMNGPDACRKIREMGCDSFIVGITGNVLPEDIAYFKGSGASWVFPKPVRLPDLEALWLEYGVMEQHH